MLWSNMLQRETVVTQVLLDSSRSHGFTSLVVSCVCFVCSPASICLGWVCVYLFDDKETFGSAGFTKTVFWSGVDVSACRAHGVLSCWTFNICFSHENLFSLFQLMCVTATGPRVGTSFKPTSAAPRIAAEAAARDSAAAIRRSVWPQRNKKSALDGLTLAAASYFLVVTFLINTCVDQAVLFLFPQARQVR